MDCSIPGFPVYHQLLELSQTRVNHIGDAFQLSHLLSSPSPPIFNLSQHQGLFSESACLIRLPKYCLSFSISPSNEYSGFISFKMDWLVQGTLQSILQHHSSKTSILLYSAFFIALLLLLLSHFSRVLLCATS